MSKYKAKRPWDCKLHRAKKVGAVTAPIGYNSSAINSTSTGSAIRREDRARELLNKKAWEVAKSPAVTIVMTGILVWMTGSNVNILSIMVAMYGIGGPLKSIIQTPSTFKRFESLGTTELLPKMLLYIAINLILLSIGLYKAWILGLIPTDADWATTLIPKESVEFSSGSIE